MASHESILAREIARMEEERSSWRQILAQTNTVAKLAMESVAGSNDWLAREMKALQSPAMAFAQQYQDLLGANPSGMQAISAWQEAERIQHEQMQRMLDPLVDIRNSFLADNTTQKFIEELTAASSIDDHVKQLVDQTTGIGSVAKMLAQQADESREQHRRLLDSVTSVGSIQSYLKEFEAINKQWMVPSEVLGIVGSFKEIQEQLGRVALPTIDWGSAGALAEILGSEGIREQLALLGIGSDGAIVDFRAILTPVFHPILTPPFGV